MQDDDLDCKDLLTKFSIDAMVDTPELSVSPIEELARNVAASVPPATAGAPSQGRVWADMNAAKTSFESRLKDLMRTDPILSKCKDKRYEFKVNVTPSMKAKEGAGQVHQAIINHILTPTGAVKSQTQIRSHVAEMFPSHSVPKDWTKPLPRWAVKEVKRRIQNSAAPISDIKLPKAVTLSQLHAAAAAAVERHKTGAQTFKPVVEVRDTSVVINGVVLAIGNNKVKGEMYKHVRVSMPKLLQALALGK